MLCGDTRSRLARALWTALCLACLNSCGGQIDDSTADAPAETADGSAAVDVVDSSVVDSSIDLTPEETSDSHADVGDVNDATEIGDALDVGDTSLDSGSTDTDTLDSDSGSEDTLDSAASDVSDTETSFPDSGPDSGTEADSWDAPPDLTIDTPPDTDSSTGDTSADVVDTSTDGETDAPLCTTSSVPAAPPATSPFCGCPAGSKHCGTGPGSCVSSIEPKYGCGAVSCAPCAFAHATAKCASGTCAVDRCDAGWANCPGDPSGCNTDIMSSPANCGACGKVCSSGESCVDGKCSSGCAPPLTDCGSGVCADLTSSLKNCGGCGTACTAGSGSIAACVGGTCTTTTVPCASGLTNCGGTCVDLVSDPDNCGACGTVCPTLGGEDWRACVAGKCSPCPPGITACPVGGSSLHCVDTLRTKTDCGSCGKACGSGETCISRLLKNGLAPPT